MLAPAEGVGGGGGGGGARGGQDPFNCCTHPNDTVGSTIGRPLLLNRNVFCDIPV